MSPQSAIARKPSGAPKSEGGQFDVNVKGETGTSLAPVRPPLTEHPRGVFAVVDTVSEYLETDDPRITRTAIHMGGKPDTRAQAKMAALRMERAEQTDAISAKLETLAASGAKASVLVQSPNGSVDVREGTLRNTETGIAMLNKGSSTKGVYLTGGHQGTRILGVERGYGKAAYLADAFASYAEELPQLEPSTFDNIPDCGHDEPPSEIAAVYVFNHPGFEPDQDGRGSVFFVTDFQPDGDGDAGIVNGYGVYQGESGLCSEHGSMYTRDLKRWGGRVKGYQPGTHTFRDAMGFGDAAERDNDIEACWSSVKAACA